MSLPQSVVIDRNVYVREGGYGSVLGIFRDGRGSRVIHRYDPQTQQWSELPEYQYWYFTMTELSHQLVLVGGYDVFTHNASNTVAVYSTSQRSWKQPYPPMNTPRDSPAVSTYHQCLVVAGGCDATATDLATVEVLDTSVSHGQWLSVATLPVRCSRMSAATMHDMLYLLGGTLGNKVLCVLLPALTQTSKPLTQWRTLNDAPQNNSTAIVVDGSLLAVGGSSSSAIYVYQQKKNTWNKVGDLPTKREDCACCLLQSKEIVVAGGRDSNGNWTRQMDLAIAL